MKLFIISFILIGLSLAGMAAGLFLKRGCLKGTCGGLNNLSDSDGECPYCGKSGKDISNKES